MWVTRTNETLKVGDVIRLGGREGMIKEFSGIREFSGNEEGGWTILWDDFKGGGEINNCITLNKFPSLELWKPSPTISREAARIIKEEAKNYYMEWKQHLDQFCTVLDEMTEEGEV